MEEACHFTHSPILYIIHLLTLFFACEEPWGGEVAADPQELQEFCSIRAVFIVWFLGPVNRNHSPPAFSL